jgi:predicted transposase YdaD
MANGRRYDATLKHLFDSRPLDWLDLAGLPHGAMARVVDGDLATVTAAADKVVLVEGANPYVAHVEFQSGPDADLDQRVMFYNVLLRWRHEMPVRSVVFQLGPKAAGLRVTGRFSDRSDGGHGIDFSYRLVRAWELPPDQLLAGGMGTLPLAVLASAEERLAVVAAEVRHRLDRVAPTDAAELLTATYILGTLRHDEGLLGRLLEGVRHMEESAGYQAIMRRGKAEGLLEGRREDVLLVGRRRFGEPSAEVLAIVNSIRDPQRLGELVVAALDASSWTELLAS